MSRARFQTPETIPTAYICRRIVIPDDPIIIAAVNGALNALSNAWNWEKLGAVDPDDIAYEMLLRVEEFFESDCMIGAIITHAYNNLPANLLACDGGLYARVDYPLLYAKLAAGSSPLIIDADNFNTPDLRNRFVYGGADPIDYLGAGGTADHSLTVDEMPAHNHTSPAHSHTNLPHSHTSLPHSHGEITALPSVAGASPVPAPSAIPSGGVTSPSGVIIDPATVTIDPATALIDNNGGGLAHNNLPPYLILGYAMIVR